VRRAGTRGLPLVIHPDAWRDRPVLFPSGAELHLPTPSSRTSVGTRLCFDAAGR
jgi:hypothetical protein